VSELTREQVQAALGMAKAIADAIRELGSVPAGELYARVMGYMSHESFEGIVGSLVKTGLVTRANHVLTWVGPK
jgi:hypothetical protein